MDILFEESVEVLYEEIKDFPVEHARDHYQKHSSKVHWADGDRIIDLGSGDGALTNVLKEFIPVNYKELIGCDASEELIIIANDKYSDRRTKFILLNIGDDLPDKMKGRFNRVTSCHALNWIVNQRQTFQNIYDLLLEGGECLLMFIAKSVLYEAYIAIAKNQKWKPWVKASIDFVTQYQNSEDPVSEVRRLIDGVGFKTVSVDCEELSFFYKSLDYFLHCEETVNPYKIPDGPLLNEFMSEIKNFLIKRDLLTPLDDSNRINYIISRIVIYASK